MLNSVRYTDKVEFGEDLRKFFFVGNLSLPDQPTLVCTSFPRMYKFPTCTPKKTPLPDQPTLVCTSFPRMYKFPTCTPKPTITRSTNSRMYKFPTCTPKNPPLPDQPTLVCTSFRLVHQKTHH